MYHAGKQGWQCSVQARAGVARAHAKHPERARERARKWKKENPDRVHNQNLRKVHGITIEVYYEMLSSQGGGCAICGTPPRDVRGMRYLHVDHDHETGRIRGLLCTNCNTAIGLLGDDPRRMIDGSKYLLQFH